jgi:PAS domain S-box-containing protein
MEVSMEYTEPQLKMLINSMTGYVVIYIKRDGRLVPEMYTPEVPGFSGLTEHEYLEMYGSDASKVVAERDLPGLNEKLEKLLNGETVQEATYRTYHKTRGFVWTHVKLRLLGTCDGAALIIGNFTNLSDTLETPGILLDHSDQKIYVIERGTYDLLYANAVAMKDKEAPPVIGQTCYGYIRHMDAPCANCVVNQIHGEEVLETVWHDTQRDRAYGVKAVPLTFFDKQAYAFFIDDLTEHFAAQKKAKADFNETIQALLSANPNALCSYRLDITRNLCSEEHGVSGYIQNLLRSDTADELFSNLLEIIPGKEQKRAAADFFNRESLRKDFDAGNKMIHLDYQRYNGSGSLLWVRTFVNMLRNPETGSIIAVFYSLDITDEKRKAEIFSIITNKEYDYVALLYPKLNMIEFLSLNSNLMEKYHKAFGQPGVLYDFDISRHFAADNWIDEEDKGNYLKISTAAAVQEELDRCGQCEFSIKGHYTGHPDEMMCRRIQHYYLSEEKDAILIIQTDVTQAYLRQQNDMQREKSEKEQLADILDRLSAGICVLVMPDPDHIYTSFCNQQLYRMLDFEPNASTAEDVDKNKNGLVYGYFRSEFSGVHPDDLPRMRKIFRQGYSMESFSVTNIRYMGGKGEYKNITIDLVLREIRRDERVFYAVYRDVTEEVKLQSELASQRKKQLERTIVDTIGSLPANYVLYLANADGTYTAERYSDEFCHMKGCTQEEIKKTKNDSGFDAVHPDDREELMKTVNSFQNDGRFHHAIYRIITADGSYKWVSVNFAFFIAGDKKYLYASYTDIDDLKKHEQQLHEQYNSAQAYLDSVSGSYIATRRINLTQNLIESVRGTAPLKEAEGIKDYDRYVSALLTTITLDKARKNCRTVYSRKRLISAYENGERTVKLEYPYMTPEGEQVWVCNKLNLLKRPENGDIIAFSSVSNINQEKLTGAIMDTLVSTKYDNICCIDARNGRIVFYYSPSRRLGENAVDKGADYEKMMSLYNEKYIIPEERDTCTEAMRLDNVLRELDDKENCVVFFSVNKNGKVLAKQVEYFYIDKGSRLIALVRTDITEAQKQQMEQRQKLQEALTEAESANEAKSDFLSRMSHDIRTPLNGIIGMTYLTEQMQLPPKARENLRKIDTSSKFLLGLINDILDMSKAESGKLELHPEPYNEKTFVRYLDAVIAPLCREKNIKFTIDAKTVKGIDMLMDPLRINQVFFNLLSNAVKFTPEGGTVTYRLREKRIGRSKISLTGQVSDTGVGISSEFQKVIFDPFTQENRKDSSEARGSGLGLAIVKKIIDAMGGTVEVESEIGKGTIFTVHAVVDCVPSEESRKEETGQAQEDDLTVLEGRHILLCEDHPLNQEIVVTLLKEKGAKVSVAEDGKIGVEMFARSMLGFYDVVLMDVRMPVMNGYEATEAIRALDRPDAAQVQIIAMTADAFSDDVQRCMDCGMNGHIAKPVDPQQLYRALCGSISIRHRAI